MPGLLSAEKKARLAKISYRDFLLNVVKADPRGHSRFIRRAPTVSGESESTQSRPWTAGPLGYRDFRECTSIGRRSEYELFRSRILQTVSSYRYHFPDGNASIARLLVRDLIPRSRPWPHG